MLGGFSFGAGRASKKASTGWTTPADASVPLRAWYRMDLGITHGGGVVTALADQSGVGDSARNMTSSGGAGTEPNYTASDASYNNRPTIGGDSARYMTSGSWSTTPFSPALSIVIVGNANSVTSFLSDHGSSSNMVWSDAAGSGRAEYYVGGTRLTSSVLSTSPSAILITDDGTGGGSAASIYVNNFTTASASRGTLANGTPATMSLMVGHNGVSNLNGKLAEVIFYSGVLTSTDIANLRTYLNDLYNLGIT